MAQLPRKDAGPYADTNDAERLAADPTVQMVGSRERRETSVAFTSARHWVDTDVRTEERNDQRLAHPNTDLVQHEAARPLTRRSILDIDSSERPVHGAHEQSPYNGHADKATNIETAERLVRQAAACGAKIACLPELFNTMYFCVETRPEYFDWAEPVPGPTTERMGALARALGMILIAPVFEQAPDGRYFNTAAVLGPDGRFIGKYRKSSIPCMDAAQSPEPRGNEKFYFSPGDLGFPTFDTPFARIGILICYDRHFPEAARVLGLGGAEIVFVPTATTRMTRYLWDVELRAHAIANVYYVCGVNKVGVAVGGSTRDHQ